MTNAFALQDRPNGFNWAIEIGGVGRQKLWNEIFSHERFSLSSPSSMVVEYKYRFLLQRLNTVSKIRDKLCESHCIGATRYFMIKAVVDALTYSSENSKRARSIFSLGKWYDKLLAVVVPGFLLDHVSSEGSLIKVNDRLIAHDPVSEFHGKFNSLCL